MNLEFPSLAKLKSAISTHGDECSLNKFSPPFKVPIISRKKSIQEVLHHYNHYINERMICPRLKQLSAFKRKSQFHQLKDEVKKKIEIKNSDYIHSTIDRVKVDNIENRPLIVITFGKIFNNIERLYHDIRAISSKQSMKKEIRKNKMLSLFFHIIFNIIDLPIQTKNIQLQALELIGDFLTEFNDTKNALFYYKRAVMNI